MTEKSKKVSEISDADLDKVQGGGVGHELSHTLQQSSPPRPAKFFDEADALVSKSTTVDSQK